MSRMPNVGFIIRSRSRSTIYGLNRATFRRERVLIKQFLSAIVSKPQEDCILARSFPAIQGYVADKMDKVTTKRILFIDDELNIRQIVKACLESLGGWEVVLAASAQEGLVKAVSEKPDAILLDVMMPEMDGLVLLRQLQVNPVTQSIPVVFLTGRLSLTEPQRFQRLGVKGSIAKPFNSLTLVPQIANALGWNLQTQ